MWKRNSTVKSKVFRETSHLALAKFKQHPTERAAQSPGQRRKLRREPANRELPPSNAPAAAATAVSDRNQGQSIFNFLQGKCKLCSCFFFFFWSFFLSLFGFVFNKRKWAMLVMHTYISKVQEKASNGQQPFRLPEDVAHPANRPWSVNKAFLPLSRPVCSAGNTNQSNMLSLSKEKLIQQILSSSSSECVKPLVRP